MKKYLFYILIFVSAFLHNNCTHRYYCTSQDTVQKKYIPVKEQNIDSSTYQYILPYKTKIDADLNVKIASTQTPLEKNTDCNKLAQLVFESMQYFADSVLHPKQNFYVLINYGGLRADIPQGEILKKHIFELMPFDNSIVILQLNDNQKEELLNKVKDNKKLLLKSKFNESANILVTSDYLYQGGDNCEFLKNCKPLKSTHYLIRNAIIRYCIMKNQLHINCFY
ncbi:MAG: 5'-nucleotidase C-terminal domain-containing protein [Bacteroidia bacterium]|nr:5'-nucleotidase C-terminal domain-containing protein [Bacteroidia bacterium]